MIAALLDAQGDDGAEPLQTDEERQAKKARLSGAAGGGGGRVLSAPFKDCSLPSMQIFLCTLYRTTQGSGRLVAQPWEHIFGAMRLADQLDAPLALRHLERVAIAKLGSDCSQVEHWLPALLGADSLVQQAPQLYDQSVAMAASALLCSMPAANSPPLPAQRLLADPRLLQLRPDMHVKLLGTFAAGVRGNQGPDCRWRTVSSSLAATWEQQGEFTVSLAAWPALICWPGGKRVCRPGGSQQSAMLRIIKCLPSLRSPCLVHPFLLNPLLLAAACPPACSGTGSPGLALMTRRLASLPIPLPSQSATRDGGWMQVAG